MWFPFNFAKNLKDRHFVVGGSKNLKLSPNTCFGVSFQKIYCRVFCYLRRSVTKMTEAKAKETKYQVRRPVISTIIDFYKSKFPLPKYVTDRKLNMSAVFIFEIKDAKKDKIFNFLKGRFFVMDVPMDISFDLFSDIYVRLPKSITLQFFSRYSKNYINLNVKICLKSTALNK